MKIYFFGGAFDPPHKGHKLIYKHCIDLCDKFIFIPAAQSPGKKIPTTNNNDRINMLELLIDRKDSKKVIIDKFEIESNRKPNYTINTIVYLKQKFREASISMVIGQDQYKNLINWKDYKEIINKVNVVCFNRGVSKLEYITNTTMIDFNHKISSTKIRQNIASGNINKIKDYLTGEVNHFIVNNGLYIN